MSERIKVFKILPFLLWMLFFISPLRPDPSQKKGAKLNFLLITIDTLRADRVSCYDKEHLQTPNIDFLAEKGILFSRAFAHNPTTLPSHANILLGTTPIFHGVHDNANFVAREEFLSMAELLKENGYSTAAFVGGYPLDSRFGLNQGFDIYDDNFYSLDSPYREDAERKAGLVIEKAIEWLKNTKGTWFLWVHCYDPHDPYEPPEPFQSKYKNSLYDGEVAYVDTVLGEILHYLKENRLFETTLIVFTGDHGESLGQHGELTHGFLAYNTTLWVPLVITMPGLKAGKVDQMVAHIDIFPTVCEVLGIKKPSFIQGESLVPTFRNKRLPGRAIYFESLSPHYSRGWAPIRGIIEKKAKFIDSPISELYNLEKDFDELHNLAEGKDLAHLKKVLNQLIKTQSFEESVKAQQRTDTRSLEKLRSLGYIANPQAATKERYGPEDDVKILLPYHEKSMEALALCKAGKIEEGVASLREIITKRQDMDIAYANLAYVFQWLGRLDDGLEVLREGLDLLPASYDIFSSYIRMLVASGQNEKVIELFEAKNFPQMEYDAEIWNYLGLSYRKKGAFEKALMAYNMALSIDKKYPVTYNNLGTLYFSLYLKNQEPKAFEKALQNFNKAIELDPYYASSHYGLGLALIQSEEYDKAIASLEKALKLQPDFSDAVHNLGVAYFKKGDFEQALPYLSKYRKEYSHLIPAEQLKQLDEMIERCKKKSN